MDQDVSPLPPVSMHSLPPELIKHILYQSRSKPISEMDEWFHLRYVRDLKSFSLVHSSWRGWAQALLMEDPWMNMHCLGKMELLNQIRQRPGEGNKIKGLTLSGSGDLGSVFRSEHSPFSQLVYLRLHFNGSAVLNDLVLLKSRLFRF